MTSSTRQSAPVVEGEVLAGKYAVRRVLGAGGMGVVVEARHVQLGQRVALKFLLDEACRSDEAVERFLREGRAAVQIRSEHVARVTDVGTLDSGAPFIVMEYLEGEDLSEVLAKRGTLEVTESVEYVLQACEAIAEAHSLGIIHRDLKPANLFLTRRADGSALIKVLDFGISKIDGDPNHISLTSSTSAVGSPQYMSPEQMRSAKHVDHRTDIWSVGTILFELLTGLPAFNADSLIGLCTIVATKDPPRLRTHRKDVPEALDEVVWKCLRKNPEERYPSLAELAVALMPLGGDAARTSANRIVSILKEVGMASVPCPTAPVPSKPLPVPNATAVTLAESEVFPTTERRKTGRALVVGSVAALAAVSFGAAVLYARSGEPPETGVHANGATVAPADANAAVGPPDASRESHPADAGPQEDASRGDAAADAQSPLAAASSSTPPPRRVGTGARPKGTSKPPPKSTGASAKDKPTATAPPKNTGSVPDFGGRKY